MLDRIAALCLKATIFGVCVFFPYVVADAIARIVAPFH